MTAARFLRDEARCAAYFRVGRLQTPPAHAAVARRRSSPLR